ncbi:unnamed protein product [marine sediment metagenome]|uniref:Uncharacterized protein n=1 Tax=marine sediment metagenome TaxID=412755 RepID=X1S062_9ZZZZ
MEVFRVKFTYESRRAISTAGLKRLRKRGIITENTLRERLKELRLLDDDINLTVSETNYEIDSERMDAFFRMARSKYLNNHWSQAEVMTQMSNKDIPCVEPEIIFETWNYEKQSLRRLASKGDIVRLLKKGIIAHYKDAISKLIELGYDTTTANWFVDEVIIDMGEDIRNLIKIRYIDNKSDAIKHLQSIGMPKDEATNYVEENWLTWLE